MKISTAAPKAGVLMWIFGTIFPQLNIEARAQTPAGYFAAPALLITPRLAMVPARTLQLSAGIEGRADWRAPVSGLQGTLYRIALMRADLGVSDNVVLLARGAIQQELAIDEAASQPLPGMPASGTTSDAGDFSIATLIRFYENREKNNAIGLRVETRLPNSTQKQGIGTNTTDVFFSVLATRQGRACALFGELGLGILSAPLETDVQNDVLLYGLATVWQARPQLQLGAEINGYLTTRNIIPAGTEERGLARAVLAWQTRSWAVECAVQHGLTINEGAWGGSAGITRRISW